MYEERSARLSRLSAVLVGVGLVFGIGCVGQPDPEGGGGGDTADAAAQPDPDAAPVSYDASPPDAVPEILYPAGPYGNDEGDVTRNLSWTGFVDSDADPDDDPFNEAQRVVTFEDFFIGKDPGATVIMINSSAVWCEACQDEAQYLPGLRDQYHDRGARFITAMFEDSSGYPASVEDAKSWGEYFDLNFPVVADPDDLLGEYYEQNAVPMNMFIDATTMTIINIHHGYDGSYARQILDAYTN